MFLITQMACHLRQKVEMRGGAAFLLWKIAPARLSIGQLYAPDW